jgi:cyclopropane-fatty-acyl-phospholipid synthase
MQTKLIPSGSRMVELAMIDRLLNKFIRKSQLTIIYPDGSRSTIGSDVGDERPVVVRLASWKAFLLVVLYPDRYLGEAYMNGDLQIEEGSLWDFLELCGRNLSPPITAREGLWFRLAKAAMRKLHQFNPARVARRNVAHHYDLSPALYRSFLDEDMQYSCAYFYAPAATLDEAQRAKKQHIATKLLLKPGQRILDIGCGWGGLALTLARSENVKVLGITLSTEQLEIARQRAAEAGLQDRVTFELCDYREVVGEFDRIVSVGMFEHVGTPHYAQFFNTVSGLLKSDGIALLHSIGRMHGPDVTSSWIRKYIFPGGYIPAISEVMPALEQAGLWLTDLEILRLHYASTLRAWRTKFLAAADNIGPTYDARFKRMWEFYLAISEMSFRYAGMMVFQVQLAKRVDIVPGTRDYMLGEELHFSRPQIAAE